MMYHYGTNGKRKKNVVLLFVGFICAHTIICAVCPSLAMCYIRNIYRRNGQLNTELGKIYTQLSENNCACCVSMVQNEEKKC